MKRNDRVTVMLGGKWVPGVVLSLPAAGLVKVRVKDAVVVVEAARVRRA